METWPPSRRGLVFCDPSSREQLFNSMPKERNRGLGGFNVSFFLSFCFFLLLLLDLSFLFLALALQAIAAGNGCSVSQTQTRLVNGPLPLTSPPPVTSPSPSSSSTSSKKTKQKTREEPTHQSSIHYAIVDVRETKPRNRIRSSARYILRYVLASPSIGALEHWGQGRKGGKMVCCVAVGRGGLEGKAAGPRPCPPWGKSYTTATGAYPGRYVCPRACRGMGDPNGRRKSYQVVYTLTLTLG